MLYYFGVIVSLPLLSITPVVLTTFGLPLRVVIYASFITFSVPFVCFFSHIDNPPSLTFGPFSRTNSISRPSYPCVPYVTCLCLRLLSYTLCCAMTSTHIVSYSIAHLVLPPICTFTCDCKNGYRRATFSRCGFPAEQNPYKSRP